MNYLEQLVAEWYEFSGYFVRRNVLVGKRPNGGYACELDVVAFHPSRQHLVQIEPSMDAHTWIKREERYTKKFEAGRKYIPALFDGLTIPTKVDQIALLGYASSKSPNTLAGGRVVLVSSFLQEITKGIAGRRIASNAVPEQFTILRTIQFVSEHRATVFEGI